MFTVREQQPEEAAAEADMAEGCARLKEEQEERWVSEQPLAVVKKEEDRESERMEAPSELELSLFAPVEFSDEAAWPNAPDQDGAAPRQRRPKRRKRRKNTQPKNPTPKNPRPKNPRPRRQKGSAAAAGMKPNEESDEADDALEQPPPGKCAKSNAWDLPSQQTSRSAVWDYFEYFINPDGELEDYGYPTCKVCQQKVPCKRGNTSNMLRHLQENHAFAYWETKRADAVWLDSDSSDSEMKMELDEPSPMSDWSGVENQSEEDYEDDADYRGRSYTATPRRRRQVRSSVWHYFHFSDADTHTGDRRPSCKICGWKLTAGSSGSTSNMRQHLQSHHKIVCPLTKSAGFSGTVAMAGDGDEPIKLYPPSSPRKSPVWKLFGFIMNAEGTVEENGFPVCRLCHQVVASKDGNTSNMYSHLQHHHQAVYAEMKHTSPAAPEQRLEAPESIELHPPEKRRNSPVWKYFGFIKSTEGELKEDSFPLCKLCYRRVAARDGTTSNMLNHLRRHHQPEYEEVKIANDALPLGRSEEGNDLPELFPPSRLPLSPVWDYFGYPKNSNGSIEENERPKCKACRQSIVSKQGILSNMLRHLKFYHAPLFDELKSRTGRRTNKQYKERIRAPPVQANPDELYPPKTALKSGVWKHFGYLKNSKGVVVPDGFPVCKLCLRKVSTPRACTTNMMVHLQRYHTAEFTEMRASSDDNEDLLTKAAEPEPVPDLFPPRDFLEPVWEYFGYSRDPDGNVQADGEPTCKLCETKVPCPGESSKFLHKHLWKKHNSVYVNIRVSSSYLRAGEGVSASSLFPPTHRVKSVAWEYFGYLKDAEGSVVCDGFPICKLCHLSIAAKGGNTTNMFKHLKDHHRAVYDQIRSAANSSVSDDAPELFPPTRTITENSVWEHFGFPKDPEGSVVFDGFTICKVCQQRVESKDGDTANMFQHLKIHHPNIYQQIMPASEQRVDARLWEHFVHPESSDADAPMEDEAPVCKICGQTVGSSGDAASSMMQHLQENHESVYNEINSEVSFEDAPELSGLYPPTQNVTYPVWEHFGFPKDPEGSVVFDGFPICKICRQRVESKDGDTANMFQHLKINHPNIYQQIMPASERVQCNVLELHSPTACQLDIRLWEHFGYPKNADGDVEEDGAPVCKICLQKLVTSIKGVKLSTHMLRHLRRHHQSVYEELQEAIGAWRPEQGNDALELHPPTQNVMSPVWDYFGYLKDEEGTVVCDGFPICKICQQKVSSKGGNTTNMFKHLKDCHRGNYSEIRSAVTSETFEDVRSAEDLHPPAGQHNAALWEHFGYRRNADGELEEDGAPFCKLCLRKLVSRGETTRNMKQHLKENHNTVYAEVEVASNALRAVEGGSALVLFPPTPRVKSAVWEYFGYPKDTEGLVVCNGLPICKLCHLGIPAKGGNTSNLFKHLKDHHRAVYDQIRPTLPDDLLSDSAPQAPPGPDPRLWDYFEPSKYSDADALMEDEAPVCKICSQTVGSSGDPASGMMQHLQENHESVYHEINSEVSFEDAPELSGLYPPTQNVTYPVWEHFGFPKDPEGSVVFDGFPICKICRQRVESKDGDTANMFQHLKINHPNIYQQIMPGAERRVQFSASRLHPPNGRQVDIRLWEHFGYPKNVDGDVEEDGAPVCKICLQKLVTSAKGGKLTTSMLRHLRRHHQSIYEKLQEAIGAWRPEQGNDTLELHPPTQNVTSPVWDYFGYLKDEEGTVVCDGFPICKICQQKVSSKGGNTTNMFKHLKDCHRGNYSEIRSAVTSETFEDVRSAEDLHPPAGQHNAALWEHFGYRRNADGELEEDGAPFCKLCLRKLVSRGETTRNMKQHLKENHNTVYAEPEEVLSSIVLELESNSSNLYPPTHKVKSAVWKFFGYPRDAGGLVQCDGFPICKLCQKKVSAKGGNTTNMFTHLRDYHRTTYNQIKATFVAPRPEIELESRELHLPSLDGLSPVWKYFGYPKDAEGALVCDGYPICRVCKQKVIAKGGGTTYMLMHLRAYHLDIYKEVKPAVAKKSIYRPMELFPPTEQGDIKLWDHFGYPKDTDGSLLDDGAPICKICLRKLIKPPSGGSPTTNMLKHLRKKHQSVYNEVQEAITTLRTEWGIEPPELHPPTQNVTSAVWRYFGYLKDADGSVVCDDFPICKLCQQKVASKRRCTTNMFKHLKDYHRHVYDEVRSAVTSQTFEDQFLPTDLHPPSGQHNPKLWEYFGYRKTEEGAVEEDGAPICKLCFRKLISKGETTSNMMQHLKENHNTIYTEVQREVNPFTIGGATELPELFPPEHRVRSGVWRFFGYLRDTEGPAECAGYPICKICLSKVSNKGKVTANMSAHLKEHHRSVYDDLKIPDRRQKVVNTENLPELFPPPKRPLSPIWEHFGLPKNEDGVIEEDACPICRICGKKVSSQDGRKMLRHLHFCHFTVYEELKNAIRSSKLGLEAGGQPSELHPPSKNVRSSVWEYFGYLKSPDGTVNVDGRPICKLCFQKVSSHGGNTTNMFKHLEDKHGFSQ